MNYLLIINFKIIRLFIIFVLNESQIIFIFFYLFIFFIKSPSYLYSFPLTFIVIFKTFLVFLLIPDFISFLFHSFVYYFS